MRYLPEEPGPVPVVDAHHHLWDLSRGRYPWLQEGYDPRNFFLGGHQALRSDFLPAHYRQASQGCRVLATVHVEARRAECEQLDETAWLHELHQHHGMPNAVVPCLDLAHPAAEERLNAQLRYPLVRGVRWAWPGADGSAYHAKNASLLDEAWLRGAAMLARHPVSLELDVPCHCLPDVARFAALFPTLPIVLSHHGHASDRSEEGLQQWSRGMALVAAQPNVHVKLSEFGVRHRAWHWVENTRIVRQVLALFGPARCMFGSDFPVASLRISFAALAAGLLRMLSDLTPQQRHAVMAANALRFYRITLPEQAVPDPLRLEPLEMPS